MNEESAEETGQFGFQQRLLGTQHLLPQGAGEPAAGLTGQRQPARIGLGEGLLGHDHLRMSAGREDLPRQWRLRCTFMFRNASIPPC